MDISIIVCGATCADCDRSFAELLSGSVDPRMAPLGLLRISVRSGEAGSVEVGGENGEVTALRKRELPLIGVMFDETDRALAGVVFNEVD